MTEISFTAEIAKLQTLVDGGIRVTLDLPESATLEMAQLAECRRHKAIGKVTFVAIEADPGYATDMGMTHSKDLL